MLMIVSNIGWYRLIIIQKILNFINHHALSLSLDSKTFIMLVIKKKLNQIVMMCTTLFYFILEVLEQITIVRVSILLYEVYSCSCETNRRIKLRSDTFLFE